jgi:hypothetical protein
VKNAFLHDDLAKTVYCTEPVGFVDEARPTHVCKLKKSLYGLKQAPRTWFMCFTSYLHTLGFVTSKNDTSLVIHSTTATAYLLLYVDDIILTTSTTSLLHHIINSLHSEFSMSDLGALHHFLGVKVHRTSNCNPISTPIDTKCKLSANDG